ncbi:MAG: response regulator transcription factor [Acidobacteriota bacterium]|nr:response regulator transcription factor [Acidobacteriota bacterium]
MLLIPTSAPSNFPLPFHRTPEECARRILLVHDYPLVCQAIRSIVEREGGGICGEVSRAADAVGVCQLLAPGLVILNLEMPFVDGLAIVRDIVRHCPRTQVIVLSGHAEPDRVMDALWAGVRGYVLKTSDPADLLNAIREVSRGQLYYCPEISEHIVNPSPKPQVTDRERQVIELIARGFSTKLVAAELGISVKTADTHRTKVMNKLKIHETASLVRFAIRQGFIEP